MSSVVEAGPGQQPSENPEFVRYRETAAQFNARKQAAVHDRRLQPLPVHHELLRHRWLLGGIIGGFVGWRAARHIDKGTMGVVFGALGGSLVQVFAGALKV